MTSDELGVVVDVDARDMTRDGLTSTTRNSSLSTHHSSLIARLRARCGEFWWWSALVFLSCRAGDLINAFIGLWLVPRYVGAEELGAALPLSYLGTIFGIPLAILIVPFSRWLTIYAAAGELGKVKRLLRIVLGGVVVAFVLAVVTARFLMPHLFERLRVAEGSLGLLIVCSGLVGPVASAFHNALQGLKRFGALSFANIISAPVRLVTMLVAMPFRALSGYMLGQLSAPAMMVAVSSFTLRRELGGSVKSEPLGRADIRAMVRYTIPIAVHVLLSTALPAWQMLMVRQRLPEVESAAFYMISRLAEIAAYAGVSLTVVVFPMAAEAGIKGGNESLQLLKRLLAGTILPGVALTVFFVFAASPIMRLVPVWATYEAYSAMLPLYSLRITLAAAVSAFVTFEMASANFRFLWYWGPLMLIETGGLVAFTGYGAFRGILPDVAVDWMQSLNAASLDFFIRWFVASSAVTLFAIAIHIVAKLKRR